MKRLRHPVRAIREPFGTAGLVIACVALVLALTGAAFAAGKLSGQQKKEVERIAKRFQGTGPQGPQGPQGEPGAPGLTGASGQSVAITALAAGEEGCADGGAKFSAGASSAHVCNGSDGESVSIAAASEAECPTGGTRFSAGVDTGHVCNGAAGATGATGSAGVNGESVTIASASAGECANGGTKFSVGASSGHVCNGATGSPGTNGNTVRSGNGAPAAGLGANGDFYIDVSSFTIYGPKTGSGWGSGTSLVGGGGGGGGTITSVTVSGGLTGGGTSGAVNVGVDPTQIQSRVSGTCAEGSAIRTISETGTVVCQTATGGGGGETVFPTLPSGKTETGVWAIPSMKLPEGWTATVPYSFTIPLATKLTNTKAIYQAKAKTDCEAKSEPEKAECLTQLTERCPGTVIEPKAAAGFLCIYQNTLVNATFLGASSLSKAGGALNLSVEANVFASGNGAWAVTAP
jgi:hypothetical protein